MYSHRLNTASISELVTFEYDEQTMIASTATDGTMRLTCASMHLFKSKGIHAIVGEPLSVSAVTREDVVPLTPCGGTSACMGTVCISGCDEPLEKSETEVAGNKKTTFTNPRLALNAIVCCTLAPGIALSVVGGNSGTVHITTIDLNMLFAR